MPIKSPDTSAAAPSPGPPFFLDLAAGQPPGPQALRTYLELLGAPPEVERQAIREAQEAAAALLGGESADIIWTTGGTDGAAQALFAHVGRETDHIVTSAIEHAAVEKTLALWEKAEQATTTRVPAGPDGRVSAEAVLRAITPQTRLVSITALCNETGVIQDIAAIAAGCRKRGVCLHTDAVQAVGRVDLTTLGADFVSIAGHKLAAVGGVGALLAKKPLARLAPWRDREAPSAAAIGALGVQLRQLSCDLESRARLTRDAAEAALLSALAPARILGAESPRGAHVTALHLPGVPAEAAMMALDVRGFAISNGSACSSGAQTASPILQGMGLSPTQAREVIRISWPAALQPGVVRALVEALRAVVSEVRQAA